MATIGPFSNFPQGFANGISVRGVPLLQAQPGQVFWLNNSTNLNQNQRAGADGNRGTFLDPFATLNFAINQCVPGRGDIIMVGSGHAETISTLTYGAVNGLTIDTSDIAIIGLGSGSDRPQFTFDTAATTTALVYGNNISFQNIQFVANFANITSLFTLTTASVTASFSGTTMTVTAVGTAGIYSGITVTGTGVAKGTMVVTQLSGTFGGVGTYLMDTSQTVASTTVTNLTQFFSLDNCEVRDTSASLNFLSVVTTSTTSNAADGLSITRSNIYSSAATSVVTFVNPLGTNDRWNIAGNYYSAKTTNASAVFPIATGKVLTNFVVRDNLFNLVNAVGTATGYLITTNGSTNSGFIHNNIDHCLANATYLSSLLVTASSGFVFGQNWHSRTADKSPGVVLPAADS